MYRHAYYINDFPGKPIKLKSLIQLYEEKTVVTGASMDVRSMINH